MEGAYRIVLADDHAAIRQSVRIILRREGDLSVVGKAGDGLELLDRLAKITPDLVILDVSMPRLGGIECIPRIKAIQPDTKVLVLTIHRERAYL